MKKNISINISGIIFHIEEDGYETLKKYLDSINKYFSTFEDSSEILADIEGRIAEIFLSKLNEEKQVITAEDVSSLVATMGSVSDFKAAEDVDEPETASTGSTTQPNTEETFSGQSSAPPPPPPPPPFNPSKQLLRDQKRKIMGGVCAGLGNYFNIDPLWVRLLFALLFFAYGITFFVYIIMWIIVPGSYDLDEAVTGKKMFRDPERKIIGGVSGGVAAFLGLDIIAVRVIFIALIFGAGLGVFLYIVLWLILPEARTLSDRVQMQGEPVTLSNIESTIKKSQSEKVVAEDESTLTKVLMFPFRLIGMILTGIGKILVPILEVIRVAIGVIVTMWGIIWIFVVVVTAGILFGIFSASALSLPWLSEFTEATVPVDVFLRGFSVWTAVAAFLGTLIPSIFLVLLGVSIIARRIVFSATAGWSLFVLFFVSAGLLAVGIPKIVMSFKEDGGYTIENSYPVVGKKTTLKINEIGMDDYHVTRLTLIGHNEKTIRLEQEFEAQGTTRAKAIDNAKMVTYNVSVRDSVFTFDNNIQFTPNAVFRAQRLQMKMYIPYDHPFVMDEGIARLLTEYVGWEHRDNETWKLTEARGLECVSCPAPEVSEEDEDNENWGESLSNFDEVEVSGKFDVRIRNGHDYNVELIGPDREKEKYNIYRSGSTLVIDYEGKNVNWSLKNLNIEDMRINITMPSLKKLEATGMGSIRFDNFNVDDMEIESRGPVNIRGEISTQRLTLTLNGKSELELSGNANTVDARLELASKLRAYSLNVNDAIVEVSGGSNAKVNVSGNLEIEEGVASEVDYRGSPNVVKRD